MVMRRPSSASGLAVAVAAAVAARVSALWWLSDVEPTREPPRWTISLGLDDLFK